MLSELKDTLHSCQCLANMRCGMIYDEEQEGSRPQPSREGGVASPLRGENRGERACSFYAVFLQCLLQSGQLFRQCFLFLQLLSSFARYSPKASSLTNLPFHPTGNKLTLTLPGMPLVLENPFLEEMKSDYTPASNQAPSPGKTYSNSPVTPGHPCSCGLRNRLIFQSLKLKLRELPQVTQPVTAWSQDA